MDLFGDQPEDALASGPPVAPADLEPVLDGAGLWGLELDTSYRVLAATFEPTPERYPWADSDDRRIQVLMFPVSTILASLRTTVDGRPTLQTFDADQLVDVAAAFGGVEVKRPLFGHGEPRPGEWGPRFSMEGRSSAPDGTTTTLLLSLHAEGAAFDVFARFDELRLRGPAGDDLEVPSDH